MAWVVAQTHKANEIAVAAEMAADGIGVYCPKALVERMHARKVYEVEEALFPRYFFVEVEKPADAIGIRRAYQRGISMIISFGGMPSVMPARNIELWRSREIDGYIRIAKPEPWLPSVGDGVRITEGPFTGHQGIFTELRGDDRAFIMLTMFNVPTQAEVDISHLEAA